MAEIHRRHQRSLSVAAHDDRPRRWRAALAPLAVAYGAVIRYRNRRFDRAAAATYRVDIPVLSVGNITVGGTGKTPMVIDLASRLLARGRKPAVVTRGYRGTAEKPADEVLELRAALPGVCVVVDPNRVRGARAARRDGADCVLLDDGFQHRRLARDLDLVLVDALDPWGDDRLLPAGRLREPVETLARADAIVVTRANLASAASLQRTLSRIGMLNAPAAILKAAVNAVGLVDCAGRCAPLEAISGLRVLPVAAIGAPRAFLDLLVPLVRESLAANLFRDHYAYAPADVQRIAQASKRQAAQAVVTTRKDWVKLAPLWHNSAGRDELPPLYRLDISTYFDPRDQQTLESLLDRHFPARKA